MAAWGLVAGLALPVVLGGLPATPSAPTRGRLTTAKPPLYPPRTVVLYGDSLANQAAPYFVKAVERSPNVNVRVSTWDGTAPCDWLPDMSAEAKTGTVSVAVIDFSGNSITPCMRGAPYTSAAYYLKYLDDVTAAATAFVQSGARVVLVGSPQSFKQYKRGGAQWSWLNQVLAGIANAHPSGVSYDDAGRAVMVDGHFTWSMACRSDEPCLGEPVSGENVVRAPDGFHFCPTGQKAVDGRVPPCGTYMSGAFRYGLDMADAALGQLDRLPPAAVRLDA
jgi:hypothetical protein